MMRRLLLLASLCCCALAFREGEFISSARKSQYQGLRTQWHDLLGSHCPRFGFDRTVALPLPKPHVPLVKGKDQYKIQLSFDGDRHITPWIKVMGPGAPSVPVVHVQMRRAGEELLGVAVQMGSAPVAYQHLHAQLIDEWRNESHWPKHLLIQYRFKAEHEVDLDRGLYVLMAIGLLLTSVFVISAASGAQSKLAKFLQEMTVEDSAVAAGGPSLQVASGGSASSASSGLVPPPAWTKGQGKAE